MLVIGAVASLALWSLWPRSLSVDGRTNIYEVRVFAYDSEGNLAPATGVTFLSFQPYAAEGGTGTRIIVIPRQSVGAETSPPVDISLSVKVPAMLWGSAASCDPNFETANCTSVAPNWKWVTYRETWDPASLGAAFEGSVFIPPYEGVGYGVGQNDGHVVVSLPKVVLPQISSGFEPDIALTIPGWRSYQWQGSAPQSTLTSSAADDTPAFLLNGRISSGIYFAPGFTSSGFNPTVTEREDRDVLLAGALLGVLGGILVELAMAVFPQRVRVDVAAGSAPSPEPRQLRSSGSIGTTLRRRGRIVRRSRR